MIRIGSGYDVHKLVEGRKLIIGGVDIPHTMGLLGHSDADVLLHSISDALLGAAAMGDIGCLFQSPVSWVLIILSIAGIFSPFLMEKFERKVAGDENVDEAKKEDALS